MKIGEACVICKNIYRNDKTDEEKRKAVDIILEMETYNGITKAEFRDVLAWLTRYR